MSDKQELTDNPFIALRSLQVPLSLQLGLDHIQRASCNACYQTTSHSGCRVTPQGRDRMSIHGAGGSKRSEMDSPIMLLVVHSLRFSGIFYPCAQLRGFSCEREQTRRGMLCWRTGQERKRSKTNHIIPFPTLAVIIFQLQLF
jgi:hypothetical protein